MHRQTRARGGHCHGEDHGSGSAHLRVVSLGGLAVAVLVLVNGNHKAEREGEASQIDFPGLISLRYSPGI